MGSGVSFLDATEEGIHFLLEEQICNCSGVPSCNANSAILQTHESVREIQTGAGDTSKMYRKTCNFFWKKRMNPFFRRNEKTYILNTPRKSVPLPKLIFITHPRKFIPLTKNSPWVKHPFASPKAHGIMNSSATKCRKKHECSI